MSADAKATGEPKRKRSVLALVGQAGAIVSLVSGLVGLVFVFRPGCQPQPPPDRASAAISDVSVEPGVRFGQYLQRLEEECAADEQRVGQLRAQTQTLPAESTTGRLVNVCGQMGVITKASSS